MALSIVTKKRFENKVKKLLEYLLLNWYDKVADNFILVMEEKMELLSEQPFIGSEVIPNSDIRTYLITKHNRIYYRIKGNKIIFINMFDTRMDPQKNPFNKSK
jgi:plasmid stabilization system protein ParE